MMFHITNIITNIITSIITNIIINVISLLKNWNGYYYMERFQGQHAKRAHINPFAMDYTLGFKLLHVCQYVCNSEDICLHDFLEILKRSLQNFRKILKKCFLW